MKISILLYFFFQGSAFKYRFNPVISQIKEAGFFSYWMAHTRAEKTTTKLGATIKSQRPSPLTLNQIQSAFMFFGLGLTAAAFAFLIELLTLNLLLIANDKPKLAKREVSTHRPKLKYRSQQKQSCKVKFGRC